MKRRSALISFIDGLIADREGMIISAMICVTLIVLALIVSVGSCTMSRTETAYKQCVQELRECRGLDRGY